VSVTRLDVQHDALYAILVSISRFSLSLSLSLLSIAYRFRSSFRRRSSRLRAAHYKRSGHHCQDTPL